VGEINKNRRPVEVDRGRVQCTNIWCQRDCGIGGKIHWGGEKGVSKEHRGEDSVAKENTKVRVILVLRTWAKGESNRRSKSNKRET